MTKNFGFGLVETDYVEPTSDGPTFVDIPQLEAPTGISLGGASE